jgi:OMF family outer membrane factor
LSGTLALNYNLYTSGGRRSSIRAAEQQVRYEQLAVEIAAQQLRLDVSTDYYNLQSADQSVRIYQAAVTNAQASLRDAQAQERAGVGTRFDTLRAQVQLANSLQNLTVSEANQQTARRQLAQRLSIAQSIDLSAADPVQIAGLWNRSLEQSIVLAYKNRAELEQFLTQRNIFEQNRRLALSNLGPQVSLFADYNVNDNLTNSIRGSNPATGRRFGDIGGSDTYSVGAQVNLLLFDGGDSRARAAQAAANKAIAETSFASERNIIRFDVEQYYANLQANLANIQLSSAAVVQSREELRLARLRFQAGVGTQTDVISAENDLTNAEGSRVNAILTYNKSLASLQRSVSSGRPR